MVVVLHIGSDRNESGAATRLERAFRQTVNEGCGAGRASRLHSFEQAPADGGKNSEAGDDQRAGDDAAQRGARRGMRELGAAPGAAAQARRKDHAQEQIELAVTKFPTVAAIATGS